MRGCIIVSMSYPQRIGLYGGTFNPIHEGHLWLAQTVYDALNLDHLIFIPAAHPPHKPQDLPFKHRYAMIKCALTSLSLPFTVSDIEAHRPGPSYTADTLRHFHRHYPEAQLWWLLGEDALQNLHHWHQAETFHQYARFAVIGREGYALTSQAHMNQHLPQLVQSLDRVSHPPNSASSTQIREALKQRPQECPAFLPAPVYAYIVAHQLYR